MKKCKVVINTCYGGFGLSDEAVLWLEQNAKDEKLREFLKEERKKLSQKKMKWDTVEGCMASGLSFKFCDNGIPRHHQDLVKVVETLKDKASGEFSDLKVVTLKGNKYRVEKYNGAEYVMEPEDYEFITIED